MKVFTYEVYCGDPGTPQYGYLAGMAWTEGSEIRWTCQYGYLLSGCGEAICGFRFSHSNQLIIDPGGWTCNDESHEEYLDFVSTPTCDIVSCGDPGVPEFGSRVGDVFTFGAAVSLHVSENSKFAWIFNFEISLRNVLEYPLLTNFLGTLGSHMSGNL